MVTWIWAHSDTVEFHMGLPEGDDNLYHDLSRDKLSTMHNGLFHAILL